MAHALHNTKARQSLTHFFEEVSRLQGKKDAHTHRGKPTILLVDDDPGVLVSLARVLLIENWHVLAATNGEEALELLSERQPDLLITDLNMGNISGWDLLFHENMQRPGLPIFVITALPPSSLGGADHFATRFFQKPLNLEALVLAIRRSLGIGLPESVDPGRRSGENCRKPKTVGE